GHDFRRYAAVTMAGEVKRHFRDRAWAIRVPRVYQECRSRLITDAIATGPGREAASPLAQTMISTSIGLKHQVTSREVYLERLKVAIDLLLR
ncbi:hypothetical protein AB0L76_54120, partial [Nonomuraea fuscirosea]